MPSTPILPFATWASGTNQNSIPANDNALRAEILQRNVNNSTTAQPGSPADGDCYIIQSTHTGAQWASLTPKDLAIYKGGTWYAFAPTEGNRVSVSGAIYVYTAGAWTLSSGGGGSVAGSDKQIQYNNAGAFGAEAGFEYDQASNTLTVVNATYTGLALTAASATGGAGLRLPHGAAPTTPTNGDLWTTTAGIYARINGATVGPLAAAAGGGSLTNWTEAVNTSSPNATVPVATFTATNAATDVDAAILPKGQGALLRQIPTSTAAGGNKRGGTYVVDWQGFRSAADQVASGVGSVIGGGTNNKASGGLSVIAGGDANTASNTSATVAGGSTNTASATYSTVAGGVSNTASGSGAFAVGQSNTASGQHSMVSGRNSAAGGAYSRAGGYGSTARGLIGADVYSSYYDSSTVGKYQRGSYTLFARTTTATATAMTADLAAAGATNQLILANSMCVAVSGLVTARKATTGDYATWSFTAAVVRDASAASTVVTAAAPTSIAASAGASTWVFAISADTTNGGLRLTVTGAASSTISWTAAIQTAEVFEP
jgi:hypothetical protein